MAQVAALLLKHMWARAAEQEEHLHACWHAQLRRAAQRAHLQAIPVVMYVDRTQWGNANVAPRALQLGASEQHAGWTQRCMSRV